MGRYRRTVSFPNPPSPNPRPAAKAGFHVRSASLPCGRSHPLIPQLREEVDELRAWNRARAGPGLGPIVTGLARLKGVLDSLDDVLQLPLTQDSLSSKTDVVERLLEDFLRFVDVYGIFRASMLGLKQEVSAAQIALRRKDDSRLGLYIKTQKKIASEVGKLISAIGPVPEQPQVAPTTLPDYDDELGQVIRDVHRLTALVSEAVFGSVAGSFGPGRRPGWASFGLGRKVRKEEQGVIIGEVESLLELRKMNKGEKKRMNEEEEMRMKVLKEMQELEDCMGEMERESERVFRSLISTRVSLLNILTHA
ncbi:Dystrophin [Bienertia sinuspersici]